MKKLISFLMAALMVLALVSCNKTREENLSNQGGGDEPVGPEQPEIVYPEILSDLHVGEASFPIQALTFRHAAGFTGYTGKDFFHYAEDIDDVPTNYSPYPICVPLGDKSLQEVYDKVDDRWGCALLVITDRELDPKDYTFFDAIPVGIIPESALETIQGALQENGTAKFFQGEIVYREDKVSPARDFRGKQWLITSVYHCNSGIYDFGVTEEGKFVYANNNTENWDSGFYAVDGQRAYRAPVIPDELTYPDMWRHVMTEGASAAEVILPERGISFKCLYSVGDYLIVYWKEYNEDETLKDQDIIILEPLKKPVKMTVQFSYGVMVSAGGNDYPMWCQHSDFNDEFLAMGSDVPFFYLNAFGAAADFIGKDVSGKVVGINRGDIPFSQKQENAKNAGAIGVIIINNEDEAITPTSDQSSIPLGAVKLSVDKALKYATKVSFVPSHEFIEVDIPDPTGPRAIDLGIVISRGDGTAYKLLWADCNLGATAPEEGGDYYAWGETDYYYQDGNRFTNPTATWQFKDGKSSGYDFSSYIWAGSADQTVSKYCPSDQADRWGGSGSPDGKTVLDPEDDAARAVLGEGWRMPTAKEFEVLAWWCNHEWTTQGGAYGMKVTSTVNGQSIFLPAVGYRSGNSVWDNDEGMGYEGYYWTSSINSKDALYASMAYLNNDAPERCFLPKMATDFDRYQRYWGMQVRAVKEEETQPITSTHMGHEFVDMGNGIKIAETNIGASNGPAKGEYFAWGEVRPKNDYSKYTYRYYSDGFITRYKAGYNGETITLYPEDDPAHANWGGAWRTPTSAEWQTLTDTNKYKWEWESSIGGFWVTSKENNNSIYLPAGGVMSGSTLMNVSTATCYWSNTLNGSDNTNETVINLSSSGIPGHTPNFTIAASSRYLGLQIRPVCDL